MSLPWRTEQLENWRLWRGWNISYGWHIPQLLQSVGLSYPGQVVYFARFGAAGAACHCPTVRLCCRECLSWCFASFLLVPSSYTPLSFETHNFPGYLYIYYTSAIWLLIHTSVLLSASFCLQWSCNLLVRVGAVVGTLLHIHWYRDWRCKASHMPMQLEGVAFTLEQWTTLFNRTSLKIIKDPLLWVF